MVRSNLRRTWVHDALLKVRTSEEAKQEAFGNRTVVLSGIPKHLRPQTIIEHFGKNAGAVVGLELP